MTNNKPLAQRIQGVASFKADVAIGSGVRSSRKKRKVSCVMLGQAIGVKVQQIEKYEKGIDRISASRLEAIAQYLGVPVSEFFESNNGNAISSQQITSKSNRIKTQNQCSMDERELPDSELEAETKCLLLSFNKLTKPKMKNNIFNLIVALAESKTDRPLSYE